MAGEFNPDAPLQQGPSAVRHCTNPAHEGDAVLPATSEFFKVKIEDGRERFHRHCRRCQKRDEAEQSKSLVDAAKKLLANQTLKKGRGTPNFGDLLDEVYRKAGGYRKIARLIAELINDDTPHGRVSRRSTLMKVFEATQKETENENILEVKRQTTSELQAQIGVIAKALGINPNDQDAIKELENMTIDEPNGQASA
jgi:hypothetical protein